MEERLEEAVGRFVHVEWASRWVYASLGPLTSRKDPRFKFACQFSGNLNGAGGTHFFTSPWLSLPFLSGFLFSQGALGAQPSPGVAGDPGRARGGGWGFLFFFS